MTRSRGKEGILKCVFVCFSGSVLLYMFCLVSVCYHKEFAGVYMGDAGLSSNVRCVCNASPTVAASSRVVCSLGGEEQSVHRGPMSIMKQPSAQ